MSAGRLKILYVLPQLPWPADRGGKIVQYHLIRGMSERHDVRVAALVHHESDEEHARAFRDICPDLVTFPAGSRWSPWRLVRAAFSLKPYKAHRFFNPALAAWIAQCVENAPPDVIHCQNYYTAQYVTGREPCGRVLYKENFEALLLDRFVRDSGHNPLLRLAALPEVARTRRYEVALCGRFHRVVMISEPDREQFARYRPAAPLSVLPPGIDLDAYRPSDKKPEEGRVIFTGAMDYFPNVSAVEFFCSEVWPQVREAIPRADFYIVGQRPEAGVLKWDGRQGVTVTGRVEDVRPYLEEASVYVVPLRSGGGVRLKILEAMAMGKAIVSTPIGAEGLAVRDGENILLRQDASSMAAAVVELLTDADLRRKYETAARAFAERHGGWEKIVDRLEAIYRECVTARRI